MITRRGTRAYGDHKSQQQLHHTSSRNIIYHQASNNSSHRNTGSNTPRRQTTTTHVEGTTSRYCEKDNPIALNGVFLSTSLRRRRPRIQRSVTTVTDWSPRGPLRPRPQAAFTRHLCAVGDVASLRTDYAWMQPANGHRGQPLPKRHRPAAALTPSSSAVYHHRCASPT